MKLFGTSAAVFRAWMFAVADAAIAGIERFVSARVVRLVEQPGGASFSVALSQSASGEAHDVAFAAGSFSDPGLGAQLKASRVEVVLQPRRFMSRSLEIPARAADFIDGIVRAQIDRLTPWKAAEAVFGCSKPAKVGADRLATTVVATTRKLANFYVDALAPFHPAAVAIYAEAEDNTGRIKVFEHKAQGRLNRERLSRALLLVLAAAALGAMLSVGADAYVASRLESRRDELGREIAERRLAIRDGSDAALRSPSAVLERRKNETPATVIALDALSQVLPDHTYVTELHIEGSRLQVVGITRDAPSLIRLIEQSSHFTRATFFAPTTRAPSDPGERFHIEVHVQPVNSVSQ